MFQSAQKYAIFGSILAFYSIWAVTTLTVVDYSSPQLRITQNVRQGIGEIGYLSGVKKVLNCQIADLVRLKLFNIWCVF